MTTTRRQLREIGMEHRFDEVGRVRADLVEPIMVTPFPQLIVSQARRPHLDLPDVGVLAELLQR